MTDIVPNTGGLTVHDIRRGWNEETARVVASFEGQRDIVFALLDEVEALRHDVARHVEIASEHATECERLRGELVTVTGLAAGYAAASDEVEALREAVAEILREVDTVSTSTELRVTRDGVAMCRAALGRRTS